MNWPKYYGVWPADNAREYRITAEAFNARDSDSLLALYKPNARLVPQPGEVVSGHAAIREGSQGIFALRANVTVDIACLVLADDIALFRVQ